MKKRQCENWLDTFLKWTLEVSEAPESLLVWSALFCISAVTKKKIQFSKEYLKKYTIYPTAYVMFVGPPGVVRKSTSAGYAQELLKGVNKGIPVTDSAYINIGPTSGSKAKIVEKMAATVDGTMTLIAGEFGNIVATSPEEMYEFLQKMFDSDATAERYEHSTRGHGDEVVLNPSLNLLGCTTPEWISENSGYMLGAGFAARTVFIFENQARSRHLFYKNIGPSNEALESMRKKLVYDLRKMGRLKGEMRPQDDKLANRMEAWYQGYVDKPAPSGAETFQARKHIHTLRTAMVLSLCESDSLIITEDHFDKAIELINDVERKLSRGLSAVGKNLYAGELYKVLDFIDANAPIERGKVMAKFWADIGDTNVLEKILEILKMGKEITESDTGVLKRLKR